MRLTDILLIFLLFFILGGYGFLHITGFLIQFLILILVLALVVRVVKGLSNRNGLR